jgi:hypothetical protein
VATGENHGKGSLVQYSYTGIPIRVTSRREDAYLNQCAVVFKVIRQMFSEQVSSTHR